VLGLARPLNRLGRTVVAGVLLIPLGLLLGVALPAGFAAVARRADARIPWLWSINSATSVLGSIAATPLALHAGISAGSLESYMPMEGIGQLYLRLLTDNFEEAVQARAEGRDAVFRDDR